MKKKPNVTAKDTASGIPADLQRKISAALQRRAKVVVILGPLGLRLMKAAQKADRALAAAVFGGESELQIAKFGKAVEKLDDAVEKFLLRLSRLQAAGAVDRPAGKSDNGTTKTKKERK